MSLATRCVNGVCVCVLPRPENDFRPLALRHRPLAIVSALLLAAKAVALMAVAIIPTTADLSTITTARILQLTNQERVEAGLAPLANNSALAKAAQEKGNHMLSEDYFAHISPSGVTPWFWMQKHGYAYQVAGENLAIDFVEAEDVVAAWMASPSHRDNLLHDSYTETGIAVVSGEFQGGTSTVVVHMFGRPSGSTATVSKPTATPTPTPAVQAQTTTKPSPTPTPAPLPATPAPTPPPLDTTPPRVPRIALAGAASDVQTSIPLVVTGEPGSTIHVVAGEATLLTVPLAASEQTLTVDVSGLSDGQLVLGAYATDPAGNTSEVSELLTLVKDTEGPSLQRQALSFVLSPLTDQPLAYVEAISPEAAQITVQSSGREPLLSTTGRMVTPVSDESLVVTATDTLGNSGVPTEVALVPQFSVEADDQFVRPPARLTRVTRWISAVVASIVTVLLVLAIFIRIRVQHPALIAHASLVLLLAITFMLV